MKSSEIRKQFLNYFREKGHSIVPSSPVVPLDDPSLLFTNAGMNQFEDIFLGKIKPPYPRAASAQKCIRVSGKHNDLEEVGRDGYHHTFFEMLGNWSFGDYFKEEAIALAWELLTEKFGLEKDRLWATVFRDDDESEKLWLKISGLPKERILRFDEKENFWEMGATGPCGPCTELHYDLGTHHSGTHPNDGSRRFVEVWNLVFMQYFKDSEGKLSPLPSKNVDTGMGLERLASILQNTDGINYHTDLFQPIIDTIAELADVNYREQNDRTPFWVIADHIRALTFAIGDGAMPSNEGRGYVVRRILRRGARFARLIGVHEPMLYRLSSTVIDIMSDAFPELADRATLIARVIKGEEERFGDTLDNGLCYIEKVMAQAKDVIPGAEVFRLYDTYGFPPDLTALIANEKGLAIDTAGFERALEEQKARARKSASFKVVHSLGGEMDWQKFTEQLITKDRGQILYEIDKRSSSNIIKTYEQLLTGPDQQKLAHFYDLLSNIERKSKLLGPKPNETLQETLSYVKRRVSNMLWMRGLSEGEHSHFIGYEKDSADTEIMMWRPAEDGRVQVILKETPFYAESGGQVGDTGEIIGEGFRIEVENTIKSAGAFVHIGKVEGEIHTGKVHAQIDSERRRDIERNHTATHLLHYALRTVLGEHARQSGSLVAPDRFRFDYTHFEKPTPEQLKEIERLVEEAVIADIPVSKFEENYRDALKSGVTTLFGEKYGDVVRVVRIDDISKELCGGTHIRRTGEIGSFIIVSEESVASGIRRIEALTGRSAMRQIQKERDILAHSSEILSSTWDELPDRIENLLEQIKKLNEQIDSVRAGDIAATALRLATEKETIAGIPAIIAQVKIRKRQELGQLADAVKAKLPDGALFLAGEIDGKAALVAAVWGKPLAMGLKAGEMIRTAAKAVGGGGGGRDDFAQAGGSNPKGIDDALDAARNFLLKTDKK